MNYFFAKGRADTNRVSAAALTVNNCGYYRALDEVIRIDRPKGREDYHLLFCVRGRIDVGDERLNDGQVYLFSPHAKQHYVYHPMSDSFYCWVHFSGVEAASLLARASLADGKHSVESRLSEVESLFRLMITELGKRTPVAETLASGLLCSVLMMLPVSKEPTSPFSQAIRLLDDPSVRIGVEELADMHKMSKGHFIRLFRSYFGVTPCQYRIAKQLELTKMLLSYSSLSVTEIAARAGFDDPLYFSRLFRRHVGVSPSEYRKG